jgi:hypothetical protein
MILRVEEQSLPSYGAGTARPRFRFFDERGDEPSPPRTLPSRHPRHGALILKSAATKRGLCWTSLLLSLWLGALAHAQAAAVSASPFENIYLRVTNQFAEACFFKPVEPKTPDLNFSLAPMLLQELKATNQPPLPREQFGLLTRSNGVLTVDTSRATIYVAADTVLRKEKSYARLSYLWVYGDFALQGVRITLDGSGQPCLWEVLADDSGAELFFVTHRLEAAALAEFGKPLPGRHYAIERSWAESPKVVVARVLEDAPAVMGPMVYLKAGTAEASTLICRCMPAQAKHLARTSTYTLVPLSGPTEALLHEAQARSRTRPAFWFGNAPEPGRLEKSLRLPSAF